MGRLLKWVAFFLGMALLGLGAWVLSALLLAYSLSGVLFKHRRRTRGEVLPPKDRGFGRRIVLVVVMLALTGLSLVSGGRISTAVFGGSAILLLLGSRMKKIPLLCNVSGVEDSVLLRSTTNPLSWFCVCELKILTKDLAGALSSVREPLIFRATPRPTVLILARTTALTRTQATAKMREQLKEMAQSLLPAGVYIEPLDSSEALASLRVGRRARIKGARLETLLTASAFEVVTVTPREGFVESLGLFLGPDSRGTQPRVPQTFVRPTPSPLLWEFVKVFERRMPMPEPDEMAGYLAALGATRGEPASLRFEGELEGEGVVVRTHAGSEVLLRPSQLRELAKIYG